MLRKIRIDRVASHHAVEARAAPVALGAKQATEPLRLLLAGAEGAESVSRSGAPVAW
jgi:hypothetical protein